MGAEAQRRGAFEAATWATADDAVEMLGDAERASVARKSLTLAACACARVALTLLPAGETFPWSVVAASEAWARAASSVLPREAIGVSLAHDGSVTSCVAKAASAASQRSDHAALYAADAVAVHAVAIVGCPPWELPVGLTRAVRTEAMRRMAVLVRGHVPWELLAAAYARRD